MARNPSSNYSFGIVLPAASDTQETTAAFGGFVITASDAIISQSYSSGITLSANPTTIANTATINYAAYAGVAVYGPSGTTWTLTNLGQISETGTGAVTGISFASAGTIINSGVVSALTAGYGSVGVSLAEGGYVSNQLGGVISGDDGISAAGASATVVNAGIIAGNYTGVPARGVYLSAGGQVTNLSTGRIDGYYGGVLISGGSGTVDNLGTIISIDKVAISLTNGGVVTNGTVGGTASTASILGYGVGVRFGAGGAGTLTNYGTISGSPGSQAVILATGTVINGPSGATGALIESGDQTSGVLIGGTGSVVNYGTILGEEAMGDSTILYGVSLGGAGRISNLGGNSLIEGYVPIYATSNDTIINAGTISSQYAYGTGPATFAIVFGGGTNRLIVDPGASFIGSVSGGGAVTLAPFGNTTVIGTANGTGSTTLELDAGASPGTLSGLGTTLTGFAALDFQSGARWTVAGNNSASGLGTLDITGFVAHDTIDLSGIVAVSDTVTGNVVVFTNNIGAHATLHIEGGFSASNFKLSNDSHGGTNIIVCFSQGTRIATPAGERPIEDLRAGELVQTYFSGPTEIQWIGRRFVDCTRHPEPHVVWPVRVAANSMGPGFPHRDLFLSPNHAVHIRGDLIPIRCLINGTSIVQVPANEVTYYHIELTDHDMLWAEGLLAESYLDAGDRANFSNEGEPVRLFPDFATISATNAMVWEARGCAPLVVHGPRLKAARIWVNAWAHQCGPRRLSSSPAEAGDDEAGRRATP